MDALSIIAGAILVLRPLQYRWSLSRIRVRIAQRGGEVDRFDRAMSRTLIEVALIVSPLLGALLILDAVVV